MKNVILAVSAVAALSTAALADYTVSLPAQNFTATGGVTVTTPALTGTVTGIIFHFSYSNSGNSSWAGDMAATVGSSQWGGYDTSVNGGATTTSGSYGPLEGAEGPTGAPGNGNAVVFTSAILPIAVPLSLSNQTLVVGYGNGYSFGSCSMTDVTVTLVGTVPTPGAAAVLGLGGLALGRRRRA
jgi:MYXO-CTERM domain-containing protein